MFKISRRTAIRLGLGASGTAIASAAFSNLGYAQVFSDDSLYRSPVLPPFYTRNFRYQAPLIPVRSDSNTDYYEIKMQKSSVEILPNIQTEVWTYGGMTPGPLIYQQLGRQSVVRFINHLGADSQNRQIYTSVHLHGSASLPQYDGWADDITYPGQYKDYIFPNNRAATLWYHDHGVHRTSVNAYMGLAGQYIVADPNEKPDIPKGEFDVPIVLTDKLIDRNGRIVYADSGEKDLFGDIVLVNGVPWPRMSVKRTKYRFRFCNTGISRSYNLKLSNGQPLTVIGSDAGLLPSPVQTTILTIGVAERYEVVIDFAKYAAGTKIELLSDEVKNDALFASTSKVMRFDVEGGFVSYNPPLPNVLRNDGFNFSKKRQELLSRVVRRREFVYGRDNLQSQWTVNGRTWANGGLEANPRLGDVEIWKFVNGGGGWHHPIHVHLVDMLILSRNKQRVVQPYEMGWKDVFYLDEGADIEVVAQFGPHNGKYMMHCHNLVHEDHDMMRAFEVGQGGPDPVTTAPAKPYNSSVPPL